MGYLGYWSLLRKPFATDDEQQFFAGAPQREAIAGLNYFVTGDLRCAFLVSPRGCGMSSILHHASQMSGFGKCAVEIVVTDGTMSAGHAQRALEQALGVNSDDVPEAIARSSHRDVKTVWMVDRCSLDVIHIVRELLFKIAGLTVIVGTSPEQVRPYSLSLGQCGMQIELSTLQPDDMIEYLQRGMINAGGSDAVFSDNAAVRLHELSGGVLAMASRIAESSLAIAASHQLQSIDPPVVEAAQSVHDQRHRTAAA